MRFDLEQWRDVASPFYEVYPHEPAENAGVEMDIEDHEGLFLAKIATPSQTLVHDPATRRGMCHDYLLFERFYSGGGRAEVADIGFDIAPTHLHAIDMSQRYTSVKARSRSHGVCIPHAALGYVPGDEAPITSLALDSPKGRLLASAHAELMTAHADRTAEDTAVIAQTFVGLVRQLLLGPRSGEVSEDSDLPLAFLLRDYVTTNLHRPNLGSDMIMSAFAISRATLYRHFESEGGVARAIRDLRLERCFFELAGAKAAHGLVAAVARRWHFTDATHFNRLFRQRFGTSPSQCLSTGVRPGSKAPSDQVRIIEHWLNRVQHA